MRPEQVHERLRRYWDEDAPTYDCSPDHAAHTPEQRAAWRAVLARLLPPPPASVLDVGSGTGFLALPLARLGYRVTALDLSAGMLARLKQAAEQIGVGVEVVEGAAEAPPPGPFDVVVERLLLWTLTDPVEALRRWREVAPGGRLVSFGGVWGGADALERWREAARARLQRLRRRPPEHHAPYEPAVIEQLPFRGGGVPPANVVDVVERAGWSNARLDRLRDVEWARALAVGRLERAIGVAAEFAVTADDMGARDGTTR
jgi:SAM-dependent methyltransferase